MNGTIIDIVCPTCDKARYRSRIFMKGDVPTPADFISVDDAPSPPSDFSEPPLCYECGAVMQPIAVPNSVPDNYDESHLSSSVVEQPAVNRKDGNNLPKDATALETLFEVESDELIHNMKEIGNQLYVMTNRRVVRLELR